MTVLYKLETFLLLRRNSCLEEDRVRPVLSVEERHVAVHLAEQVHALVTLLGRKNTVNNKFSEKFNNKPGNANHLQTACWDSLDT